MGHRLFRAIVVAASLLATAAHPHGFHAAFTIIDIDAKSGALHVVHRMFTQDVETLLKARTNAAVTTRSGASFEAALESYIRAAFILRDEAGAAVPLTWSHVTVADDLVVAHLEVPRHAVSKTLTVDSQLLMETNPDQVNTVNVTLNGDTQTVVFRDGDKPKALHF